MLIARSPLRISLAGGGTDLPAYYRQFGGKVINLAIDRYFYVFLKTSSSQEGIEVASADFHTYNILRNHTWQGGLELPKAIFQYFGINQGVSLFLASEVPPGTGLGSSSTVAVGLIRALATSVGLHLTKQEIAELASYIEIEVLKAPIGKQDQYAASFGGINLIQFETSETSVTPLLLKNEILLSLSRCLLLFYTGQKRKASDILVQQKEATIKKESQVLEALNRVKAMVQPTQEAIEQGNMKAVGEILHQNWLEKKKFAKGVSNQFLDECYDLSQRAGAWGGKITGAGGGGFLLLCCPEERQETVTQALEERGLTRINFSIDHSGARVLMNCGLRLTSHLSWTPPPQLRRSI
jgi:D-glycero-alpha-D-manno-heptose-7-phosphate kinase